MEIIHEEEKSRFILRSGGEDALLEYRLGGGREVEFTRTFVPDSMRGKGVAGQLVNAGLKWARESGLRITASCSYVHKKLEGGA